MYILYISKKQFTNFVAISILLMIQNFVKKKGYNIDNEISSKNTVPLDFVLPVYCQALFIVVVHIYLMSKLKNIYMPTLTSSICLSFNQKVKKQTFLKKKLKSCFCSINCISFTALASKLVLSVNVYPPKGRLVHRQRFRKGGHGSKGGEGKQLKGKQYYTLS